MFLDKQVVLLAHLWLVLACDLIRSYLIFNASIIPVQPRNLEKINRWHVLLAIPKVLRIEIYAVTFLHGFRTEHAKLFYNCLLERSFLVLPFNCEWSYHNTLVEHHLLYYYLAVFVCLGLFFFLGDVQCLNLYRVKTVQPGTLKQWAEDILRDQLDVLELPVCCSF